MDFFEDFPVGIIVFFIVLWSVFGFGTYVIKEHKCEAKAVVQDFDYDYGLFQGCIYILPDGTHVPADNYRVGDIR